MPTRSPHEKSEYIPGQDWKSSGSLAQWSRYEAQQGKVHPLYWGNLHLKEICDEQISQNALTSPQLACECFSLLAQCGGGGMQGIKHAENWTELFDKLLASAHKTLDVLYANYETSKSHHAAEYSSSLASVCIDPENF